MVPELDAVTPYAHITVLAPFGALPWPTPAEVEDVAAFCAEVTAFDLTLTGLSRFPSGLRYLSPEPAATFRRLTHELHRAFPEYPPYGGRFEVVVPHLTVPDDIAMPQLPIHARAVEAALLHVDGYQTRVLDTFPFGTSAA